MRKICKGREKREQFIEYYRAVPKLEMCYVDKGRDI
jgi:hypothetical protein